MGEHCIETSVIVPVYNEEKHIDRCIRSLIQQDYPRDKVEFIFVDGNSTDRTAEIIDSYASKSDNIRLLHNPNQTVPYAMNIGIGEAKGQYIVRLDGHSEYPPEYISTCVTYLNKTKADNVGGLAISKSDCYIGNAISAVLSSKFGVGNSVFRTGGQEGYVDTVPFGAFRRDVFSRYGLYDVRLTRNQDIELNYRIRKNGGKIFFTPKIKLYYLNRDNLRDFAKQNYNNGYWNIITWYLCPGSLSIRHFIPLIFVLSLVFLPLLMIIPGMEFTKWILLTEMSLYFVMSFASSVIGAARKEDFLLIPVLPIVFLVLHLSYGIGSLMGLVRLLGFRGKKLK